MSKTKKRENQDKADGLSTTDIVESRVFSLAMGVAEQYASSKRKVFRILQHAFKKLKNESARNHLKAEFKQQVSVLMRLVKAYYVGAYRKVPMAAILKIVAGLVYFVWILDFIPDFIPLLGLADDIAVIVWVYNGIRDELDEFEQWESVTAYDLDNEN
ncbi:DUF1232 domain-containing protein [Fulvivirga sp. RKSG066]|nr:DUF1232 domain-containing protein [Fulvivirga aurantia]